METKAAHLLQNFAHSHCAVSHPLTSVDASVPVAPPSRLLQIQKCESWWCYNYSTPRSKLCKQCQNKRNTKKYRNSRKRKRTGGTPVVQTINVTTSNTTTSRANTATNPARANPPTHLPVPSPAAVAAAAAAPTVVDDGEHSEHSESDVVHFTPSQWEDYQQNVVRFVRHHLVSSAEKYKIDATLVLTLTQDFTVGALPIPEDDSGEAPAS